MHEDWLCDGEQCSKKFFQALKAHSNGNRVLAIWDESGVLYTIDASIHSIILDFFSKSLGW